MRNGPILLLAVLFMLMARPAAPAAATFEDLRLHAHPAYEKSPYGRPRYTLVRDFNGDGAWDVLMNNPSFTLIAIQHDFLSLLLGNTGWTAREFLFNPYSEVPAHHGYNKMACADLNGDGRPDVIVNNFDVGLMVYLNTGDPQAPFSAPLVFPTGSAGRIVSDVKAFDFTQDGVLDIAIGVCDAGVFLFRGWTDGATYHANYVGTAPITQPGSLELLRTAELNGDLLTDLLVILGDNYRLHIVPLLATGNPLAPFEIGERRTTLGGIQLAVATTGDLNADGREELVIGPSDYPSRFIVYRHLDTPSSFPYAAADTLSVPLFLYGLVLKDVTGDGCVDITAFSMGEAYVFSRAAGDTSLTGFVETGRVEICEWGFVPDIVDLDGDGALDLVVGSHVTNALVPTFGIPGRPGEFERVPRQPFDFHAERLFGCDYDRDGRLDLIVAGVGCGYTLPYWSDYAAIVLHNNGNDFESDPFTEVSRLPDVQGFGVADLNGDGRPDLVDMNFRSYLMNGEGMIGDGTFTIVPNDLDPSGGELVLGDVNGDGIVDAVKLGKDDISMDQIVVGLGVESGGSGTGAFVLGYTRNLQDRTESHVLLHDMNDDGLLDIVVWENDTGSTFNTESTVHFLLNDPGSPGTHFRDEVMEILYAIKDFAVRDEEEAGKHTLWVSHREPIGIPMPKADACDGDLRLEPQLEPYREYGRISFLRGLRFPAGGGFVYDSEDGRDYPNPVSPLCFADLDQDGHDEFITRALSLVIVEDLPLREVGGRRVYWTPGWNLAAHDLDSDGRLDLILSVGAMVGTERGLYFLRNETVGHGTPVFLHSISATREGAVVIVRWTSDAEGCFRLRCRDVTGGAMRDVTATPLCTGPTFEVVDTHLGSSPAARQYFIEFTPASGAAVVMGPYAVTGDGPNAEQKLSITCTAAGASSVRIAYELPADGQVDLVVYDLRGRRVRGLARERQIAGAHTVIWDGTDNRGQPCASGMYLVRVALDDRSSGDRALIVR